MVPNCFYSAISSVRLAGSNSLIHLGGGRGGGFFVFYVLLVFELAQWADETLRIV